MSACPRNLTCAREHRRARSRWVSFTAPHRRAGHLSRSRAHRQGRDRDRSKRRGGAGNARSLDGSQPPAPDNSNLRMRGARHPPIIGGNDLAATGDCRFPVVTMPARRSVAFPLLGSISAISDRSIGGPLRIRPSPLNHNRFSRFNFFPDRHLERALDSQTA
jgi:hypothetical protein